MQIDPFQINVPASSIDDLRDRLRSARWSDAVSDDWDYGTKPDELTRIVECWRDYDWAHRQQALNALPQFRATIDGFGIHFLHFRGRGPRRRALLLANGWPSSFVEYLPIAMALADPASSGGNARDSFDVVIPAMPGYGFSDRPTRPRPPRAVHLFHRLMTEGLGYARYAVAGSDIGLGVATRLALEHPANVAAIHVCGSAPPPEALSRGPFTSAEQRHIAQQVQWERAEGAYESLQQTRPQTLAYALADSPLGLASWIIEKFHFWSDLRGASVLDAFGDALIDNLMIYWTTETIGSSMRSYYESARWPRPFAETDRVRVPTSVLILPKDLMQPPREWAERFYNVVRYTISERGGHFPALELPEFYADELRAAFADF